MFRTKKEFVILMYGPTRRCILL